MTLFDIPQMNQKKTVTEVSLGSLPWYLVQMPIQGKPVIFLTEDADQALRLQEAVAFYQPRWRTAFFPDWETLAYERFSPHQDLVSERLSVLWQLYGGQLDCVFVPIATAMQRLPPVSFIQGRTFWLKTGDVLNDEVFKSQLVNAGYAHVSNVVAAGEFTMRGGLLDVFPMGSEWPYRIDLFGDEIDSIKTFDPDTQRTLTPVSEIRLLPAHEFPSDEAAQALFRQRFREEIDGDPTRAQVYQAVSKGQFGSGVEYYLPLFFETALANIFDYVPENGVVVSLNDVHAQAHHFWMDVKTRFNMAQGDASFPPMPPQALFLSEDELGGHIKARAHINVRPEASEQTLPNVAVNRQKDQPLQALQEFQDAFKGKILLCAESLGRRETMLAFLQQQRLAVQTVASWQEFLHSEAPLNLAVAAVARGFQLPEQGFAVVSEADLYQHVVRGGRRHKRRKHADISDSSLRDLAEINIGDPVVHEEHGIARYMGLVNLDLGEGDNEMMLLEYDGGSQLYVPVAQLHVISRYAGQASDNISLHKLGHGAWAKAKRKAAEKAHDTAAELLNLYAQRAALQGHAFGLDEADYAQFADGFGYEETEDQASAIAATIKDLISGKPMDRLICGDVGFGKTEVALRAAFVAVMGGKQVAVLAPTTLLVEQHAQNFADRFAEFPVKVAQLSRFNSSKETKAALAGLQNGTVDIVIGTHKLVQPDVEFHNLGLVIIDEEHRFGVRQKEQLKRLRANVDVLTMTATPIPRTLSMALEGLRDFSLIATAPSRRLAVKTFVKPFSEGTVREAILRELKRGGQVYFLHNEVDTIENVYERLIQLVPEAKVVIAHGQLRERELEQVMRDFMQHRYNVLLCSTIIETGIDIPNANTIIINRADKFGLAQLHQLRGRVGRSHHQAYAYLLTPEFVSKDAEKRLDAIAAADELGSGFALAMQDLEIRGAGEILGDGQSGEILQVGLTLYSEMLKQAVRDLKKGRVPDLDAPLGVNTEIKLHSPALLPEDYCPDIHERLVLYKRLATCETQNQIDHILEELIDRFGLLPPAVNTLIESHRLRLLAKALGIKSIDAHSEAMTLMIDKHNHIDPVNIVQLIQSNRDFKLLGADKLQIKMNNDTVEERIKQVKGILKLLGD